MPRYVVDLRVVTVVDVADEKTAREVALQNARLNGPQGEVFTTKFYDRWITDIRECGPLDDSAIKALGKGRKHG